MVQDVRSSASEVDLDLLTPEGVMRALAVVRGSTLDVVAKRELRDLIFSYTSSGGDPALRTLIQTELATLVPAVSTPAPAGESSVDSVSTVEIDSSNEGVESVVTEPLPQESVVSEPVSVPRVSAGYRSGRPTPQFRPAVPASAPVQAEPTVVDMPVVAVPDIVTPVPQPLPTPDPAPVSMVPKSIVDEKLAPLAPPSEPTVEYKAPYREDSSADAARERINAIKQLVNTKVGNPVNLVDMDNNVGREYMTALLEAMKAVSGGGGDVQVAMARLESVYLTVQALFDKKPQTETPAPVTVSVPADTPEPIVEAVPPRIEPVIPRKADPLPMPEVVPTPAVAPRSAVPVMSADTTVITPMAIASSRFKNVLPVTDQEPLKTPKDLPTAAEVKARSGITDPLEDPDVDLGLEQLLGEWSLFKKSGMFGTGPKARQHPLFLKLATIPMPLILSGRFEGSTNEIRQSITDYMNGWRYEQGIIYEQDETFEHYLRRVIRHIIDSQTRRRGA
jgi:hypothetical protein